MVGSIQMDEVKRYIGHISLYFMIHVFNFLSTRLHDEYELNIFSSHI